VSEAWRTHYDRWRLASPPEDDEVDQDELDARAEDAAIERAERQREDQMFDEADRLEGS
jgi:hypothetical protein